MKIERSCGILLHPTSLPGKYGIGSLGKQAYQFVDYLTIAQQKVWQILPLGPTGYGDSPYQCFSSFAGNPLLIDIDRLVTDGLLADNQIDTSITFPDHEVDFGKVIPYKMGLLKMAFYTFRDRVIYNQDPNNLEKVRFEVFCKQNYKWLDDFVLFMALKQVHNGQPWYEWETSLKMRNPHALQEKKNALYDEINFQKFCQFIFFKHWLELKSYANRNGVKIFGDMPIYISHDSADAWVNKDIFQFDENGTPIDIAGVPPDYFSATGQRWGNPLYRWEKLEETGFKWWIERIKASLIIYDYVRIDHFRGFSAYWSIPYQEVTAQKGKWIKSPGYELFEAVEKQLGNVPVIAEDLGVITSEVVELREAFNFPGMKILQFAFDSGEENNYLPHTFEQNYVVYTGTHDNDTVMGWYAKANETDKRYLHEYLAADAHDLHWKFIRLAWASVAVMAIAPLQDVIGLGSDARMNTPSTPSGNWKWRFRDYEFTHYHLERLRQMTLVYGR